MAHDGTGTGWTETDPTNAENVKNGAKEVRDLRIATRIRMSKEHDTLATSSAGGEHKAGSAKAYSQSAAPTQRPDASTSLSAADNGRLWHDTDTDEVKVYEHSSWKHTFPSPAPAIIHDSKAAGTDGGTNTTGAWTKHTLTAEQSDVDSLVTLSSSVITITNAGTYLIEAEAVFYRVDGCKLRIRNTTSGTTVLVGTPHFTESGSSGSSVTARVSGVITASAADTFELQYYTEVAKTDTGLGVALGDEAEVYAVVKITKLKGA